MFRTPVLVGAHLGGRAGFQSLIYRTGRELGAGRSADRLVNTHASTSALCAQAKWRKKNHRASNTGDALLKTEVRRPSPFAVLSARQTATIASKSSSSRHVPSGARSADIATPARIDMMYVHTVSTSVSATWSTGQPQTQRGSL